MKMNISKVQVMDGKLKGFIIILFILHVREYIYNGIDEWIMVRGILVNVL